MEKYARIIDSVAAEVFTPPQGFALGDCFHPELAAQFTAVPPEVQPQWHLVDGQWQPQPPGLVPSPGASPYPQVSPVEFKLLFTLAERIAIKAARTEDEAIDDFFALVDDPRLNFVDLALQSTQEALQHLQDQGHISEARRLEILTGTLR
ncbi:hypothetical protein [Melaminivora sp.]|uniref:hypothetical protein n=1 Tax=Melaminivora sp. TaxID=1933032 RepID=UPI0028A6091B|nr:hypothetical protein [Melaminivora sp.]